MQKRCTPQMVLKTYQNARAWREAAAILNQRYDVNLSHTAWHDYATGRNDIADPGTRARLGLGPRRCPSCGQKHTRKHTTTRTKRIRAYGYPPPVVRSFGEVLEHREAMR